MDSLKKIRIEKKLTQREASELLGISIRSYKYYENDQTKKDSVKYRYIVEKLSEINKIDEEHGLLSIDDIKNRCTKVLEKYDVDYCILFGSYSKNRATEKSDVDLLISTGISGLKFYGIVEELRQALHKKVDVLNLSQLKDNFDLTKEILKDGIKIYG